jgi:NADP-dependent aldehyde dehydrogenase
MLVPLGPVVVFGASNFPFAYSTAGGDTACAFAAGCPVIVKAHPAHAETSEMVAIAILKAAKECNMPNGLFAHVHGAGIETGKALVMHPYTKAVGFTGSFAGGKSLFDWGSQRQEPIPVFAEMGSVNPVYLLAEKLKSAAGELAAMYAASITLSVGQFCTKPGLLVGIESEGLRNFTAALASEMRLIEPAKMLHSGIAKAFYEKRGGMLANEYVTTVAVSSHEAGDMHGIATIAATSATSFLENKLLHQEVFGPYSLIIKCKDLNEMQAVANQMEGQLTSTIMGTEDEISKNPDLVEAIKNKCGRIILNGVPTGVEVGLAMQHGGPYPASTDARFTSVGADGIKRFARPICYQNWSDHLLPDELKDQNPLQIWRTVNGKLTRKYI